MSKKMLLRDFRAVRRVLQASDFAYAPGPKIRPVKDLVDKRTWRYLQTLPDTVSIFTSNDHGTDLRLLADLWGDWMEKIPIDNGAVHRASLVATDEFQAAMFNALHGFYRVAADCLRSALEQMTIAVDCQLRGDNAETKAWLEGDVLLLFGRACDDLQGRYKKSRLRRIFQQDDGKNDAGWLRGLHQALSDYSHARPGFDALKMWEGSNGPIYVKSAFLWNVKMWLFTYATCVILLRVAYPATPNVGGIFAQKLVADIGVLRKASDFLWESKNRIR
jgi:hypothetical protein